MTDAELRTVVRRALVGLAPKGTLVADILYAEMAILAAVAELVAERVAAPAEKPPDPAPLPPAAFDGSTGLGNTTAGRKATPAPGG